MHRSGTSALCAALAACGGSFGDQLIDPMAGVNDEGFWEDARVVALNEALLLLADSTWYTPGQRIAETDWGAPAFSAERQQAAELLQEGFGAAPLQAVKDPRLSLTLPFWLGVCAELGLAARVCVINRAPLEVARSLERRDGFPIGYGLRLWLAYRRCQEAVVPTDALRVAYTELLQEPAAVMARLARELPIALPGDLSAVVRVDLRHQAETGGEDALAAPDANALSPIELARVIEQRFPVDETLREFASALVTRGQALSDIGSEHSRALATLDERDRDIEALSAEHRRALATLDQRDADIESLSAEHRAALATIDERDEQIREFDRRLAKIGQEHSHALEVIRERDAQVELLQARLESIYNLPGVGFVIRRLRKHAQG